MTQSEYIVPAYDRPLFKPRLSAALVAFQAEIPAIAKANTATVRPKDGGPAFKYDYADLTDVTNVALPLLAKHGLSFTSRPTLNDKGQLVLEYALRHTSGEADTGVYPLPASGSAQIVGAAITYARRYCLCAVTGIAPGGDDDDAQRSAAVSAPAERHESTFDSAEQVGLKESYLTEISKIADSTEVGVMSRRLLGAKRAFELSPASYDQLARALGQRSGEIDRIRNQVRHPGEKAS